MAFGNEFNLQDVTLFALADHCDRFSIDRKFLARELTMLCNLAVQAATDMAADPSYTADERTFIHELAQAIRERAKWLGTMAVHVSRVKDGDLI